SKLEGQATNQDSSPVPVAPEIADLSVPRLNDLAPIQTGESPMSTNAIERIIQQQLQAMTQLASQQLAALRGNAAADMSQPPPVALAQQQAATDSIRPLIRAPQRVAQKADEPKKDKPFSPFKPVEKGRGGTLTPRQQAALDDLVERYTARTRRSKDLTQ